MTFNQVIEKYRKISFSERDKGDRFERLMQRYLQTDPKFHFIFKEVWLWNEFPGKKDFGGKDIGIDIVARTSEGHYWAIQCKCFQEKSPIEKASVDSFLSTSSRTFLDENDETVGFSHRLWISTSNKWSSNAEETIRNQSPPVSRVNLVDLMEAPVDWKTLEEGLSGTDARPPKKDIRPHQKTAVDSTHEYFKDHDRGRLIMACGTGKTFTSLKIAETETNNQGLVLFLLPSISLLGQILREWSGDAEKPINPICICSDPKVTRAKKKQEDTGGYSVVDLALPATTDVKQITKQLRDVQFTGEDGMTVVFSTYQSIDVISKAQQELIKQNDEFGIFDLIICDEAHRTTGVSLTKEDSSAFIKVHDNDFINAHKRLYMTATPRLYSDDSKAKAAQQDAILCSMDDPKLYGEEIYRIGFGEAVDKGLLSDYKVLILTLSEDDIPPSIQQIIGNSESEIDTDDASKLIGCINALSKQVLGDEGIIKSTDPDPMQRAVAFCQTIKVSKKITNTFNTTAELYLNDLHDEKKNQMVSVSSRHMDGTMNAPYRDELLSWLKSSDNDPDVCRVLTNVRCLSEGVDVPSLDSVMFLSPKNSQIDVVQSVGRVMRKADGKKYGYIIIPVVIPSDVIPAKALDDNQRYKVVWTVLNALRAHDDRFNATVNKIDLNKKKPDQILVGRPSGWEDIESGESDKKGTATEALNRQMALQFEQLQSVVFAKMVQKVGDKAYWEQWAKNVAEIAQRQVDRIKRLVRDGKKHSKAFDAFIDGLQKNINPSITQDEAIDMLSQHIITKPVFEALFEDYSFVKNNPVSISMQKMLNLLEDQAIEKDTKTLDRFYDSVRKRAEGIDNAEGKQRIIIELYDKFFKAAFPKLVEQLGIVYTPIEVVDFIIHSVNDLLKQEFGRSITDKDVHVLDPFTGTGTFITRLLQSGLIKDKDLQRKYTQELHANEIVLLAYYIAAVNIENVYHDLLGEGKDYQTFEGVCLTDTFQLGETEANEQLFSEMFPKNSARVVAQKKAPIKVIMGNPPYSRGQGSANDDAQNQSYKSLEQKISETYASGNKATLSRDLYNSYIKAFRWSSDRIDSEEGGIIAFISGGGWIDKGSYSGFRKSLAKEFSSIYVINLRGDIRGRSREDAKREGQNVFDIMSGVSVTFLIKNPNHHGKTRIQYFSLEDYLDRKEKLELLSNIKSIVNNQFDTIQPNKHRDWINQRSDIFEGLIPITPDKNLVTNSKSVFTVNPVGVSTNRDAWVYNYSKDKLATNMTNFINFYNGQVGQTEIASNPKKISWTVNLKKEFAKGKKYKLLKTEIVKSTYRPFCKQKLYFHRPFIERPGIFNTIFPTKIEKNLLITIPGLGGRKSFCSLMVDCLPNLNNYDGGTQCFPLHYYEERDKQSPTIFDAAGDSEYIKKDGVSDFILKRARENYGDRVSKEDIFYYVYGILHSPDYRTTFANDLKKILPHIPLVEKPKDFWAFSKAGRDLAELHLNYESVDPYPDVSVTGDDGKTYTVEKMRFPKKGEQDSIIYNSNITISNIPDKAYEYVVNGKSAIAWIMERYQVTTDKKSGIKNDPNDWAKEVDNHRYILDLLLSIINVSVQTVDIVNGLPKMEFDK